MEATVKERLLTLLFPHKCFICGALLPDSGWLCADCPLWETAEEELCPRCGKRTQECVCAAISPAFARVIVPLYYCGGVRDGIYRFKYRGRTSYAAFLAALMARRLRECAPDTVFDLVTFVPMHPSKKRKRGYCQSELLARELARLLGLPVREGYLRHTGNKMAQMEQKGMAARRENARRSFERARRAAVLCGERVLLVDDVLTTGATAQVCALLLREAGAGSVWLAAAATTSQISDDAGELAANPDCKQGKPGV